MLLPDRRDWVPADHLAHFVIAAVEALDRRQVQVKPRGTGDAKDPPTMRLSLLGYRYATGPFGSALGFRQFLLRGTAKVSTEGTLVCLAYNLRRLHTLGAGPKLTLAG